MRGFLEKLNQDENDDELYNMMVDFLLDLDEETLDDDMFGRYAEIMDTIFSEEESDDSEEDEIEEEFAAKRVKISPAERAKRRRMYRKNKAKIKMKQAKYRKSAAYKRYKKKAEIMGDRGKTSTGKHKKTYI